MRSFKSTLRLPSELGKEERKVRPKIRALQGLCGPGGKASGRCESCSGPAWVRPLRVLQSCAVRMRGISQRKGFCQKSKATTLSWGHRKEKGIARNTMVTVKEGDRSIRIMDQLVKVKRKKS